MGCLAHGLEAGEGQESDFFLYGFIYGWAGSSSQCVGFSVLWLLLLLSVDARPCGLQLLRGIGLVALRRVASSQTRDGTCVACTGRQMLSPWTTRGVPGV